MSFSKSEPCLLHLPQVVNGQLVEQAKQFLLPCCLVVLDTWRAHVTCVLACYLDGHVGDFCRTAHGHVPNFRRSSARSRSSGR